MPEELYPNELDQPFAALNAAVPVAMLPVRLETRWFEVGDDLELRLRIYPDAIHVDEHQPLTTTERDDGFALWTAGYEASQGGDASVIAVLINGLVDHYGLLRARWILTATTPLNQGSDDPPNFPTLEVTGDDFATAPQAACMPSRWQIAGYDRNGARVFTQQTGSLASTLALGPTPGAEEDPNELIDAGTRWLSDFAAGEAVSMAARIPLSHRDARRLDRLLVVGVREGTATDGAAALAELLDGHQASEGLEFIPPGTATNNTTVGRASVRDLHEQYSLTPSTTQPVGEESGARLLSALGLSELDLRGNRSAFEPMVRGASAMATVVWPGTWGYYLDHIAQRPGTDHNAAARRHFIDHVRGLDPLPTIRVRKQPYGILPVTSLDRYSGDADDQQLRGLLQTLRQTWRRALPEVPRLGQDDDIQRSLVEVLSMSPTMTTLRARLARGADLLHNAWTLMGTINTSFDWVLDRAAAIESAHAAILGIGHTRLAGLVYDDHSMELDITWSARAGHSNTYYPVSPNYLVKLRDLNDAGDLHRLREHHILAGAQPRTLLYYVARQGFLAEFVDAAEAALGDNSPLPSQQWSYGETGSRADLEGMVDAVGELVVNLGSLSGISGDNNLNINLRDLLLLLYGQSSDSPTLARLIEFKEALAELANLTADKLDRLTTATLDLCSHRLDAWISSFANKRLAELRETTPDGVHVGAYGWALDIEPPLVAAQDGGSPLLDPESAGFIHAPSLAQARTSAVLYGGYRSRADGDDEGVLALDLSSDRVRHARALLDGVRGGQALGEVLGHRFERRLTEGSTARLILGFRTLLPYVGDRGRELPEAVESQVSVDVCDGVALVEAWRAQTLNIGALPTPSGLPDIAPPSAQELATVTAILRELDDTLDAVSDLLMAEGVHQSVKGNRQRAGAAFDAMAHGDSPVPIPEVCETPSGGTHLTQRVAVLLPCADAVHSWPGDKVRARSVAAPHLRAWAAKLLGSPKSIKFRLTWLDAKDLKGSQLVSLSALDLGPLDLVYLSGERDAGSSLTDMILAAMRETLPKGAHHVSLDDERDPSWPLSDRSLGEALALARSLQQVLAAARPLTSTDLSLQRGDAPPPSLAMVEELEARAATAGVHIAKAVADLAADPDGGAAAWWRAALLLGPLDPNAPGARASLAHGLAARIPAQADTDAPLAARLEAAIAALKTALGRDFVVLPKAELADDSALAETFADQATLLGDAPEEVGEWLHDYARVRPGLEALDHCLSLHEALNGDASVHVGHLPHSPGTPWIGHTVDSESAGPRLSMVVHTPFGATTSGPVVGLLVDAWTEVVPQRKTTTGLAFNYDAPRSRAPQALLLAVHPEPSRPWAFADMESVLLETLDLAALRCVEPGLLGELGQLGPATMLVNRTDDASASDPRGVATHLVHHVDTTE